MSSTALSMPRMPAHSRAMVEALRIAVPLGQEQSEHPLWAEGAHREAGADAAVHAPAHGHHEAAAVKSLRQQVTNRLRCRPGEFDGIAEC